MKTKTSMIPRAMAWVFLFVLLVAIALTFHQPSEPEYEGRKLSSWLEDFDYVGSSLGAAHAAGVVAKMGTNCVPFLLHRIQSQDSRLRPMVMALLGPKRSFKFRHSSAQSRQYTASRGFQALGSRAEFAIPELAKLITDPRYCHGATMSLSGMSANSVPVLIRTLTNENAHVQTSAARALRLWFEIWESRKMVRLDDEIDPLITALLAVATGRKAKVRPSAFYALRELAQAVDGMAPLPSSYQMNAPLSRWKWLLELCVFSPEDHAAIPALLDIVEDPNSDESVRQFADDSLKRISSEGPAPIH